MDREDGIMSDMHGHRDRSGDWHWEPRANTAVSRFSRSPMAWLAAAAFLFVFAWAVAGNSLSFDSARLDSWCGHSAVDGSDVTAVNNSNCNPCVDGGVTEHYSNNPLPSPKNCESPTPVVDCARTSSVNLNDPAVPTSSEEYGYSVHGCGITYVKLMGCWEKNDVDHVASSAGTIEILDDGKIKVSGLTDANFPLDVTVLFINAFPSGSGSVNTWLFTGPGDSDGDSIWADGPICVPVTETPTPPTETPSPPPTESPPPTVDCAKTSSVDFVNPSLPDSTSEFSYTADGCGIEYVKFMGCWTRDEVDHVVTSAGTVEIHDDGKIKIAGLTDADFPLDVRIVFTHSFPRGGISVNIWLFQGPADSDGDSVWLDGPICIPVTEAPTPPTETPPPPPTETPPPPTETPTTPPPPETDLAIVKSDQPDPVQAGGTLAYTITVSNISEMDAENVVMTDALPTGVALISATPGQGSCAGATCNLGTIPAHQAVAISVVVTLDAGVPALLTNVACVATSTTESNLSNNCDEEETQVPTPTPLGATSTPKAPSDFPNSGGLPGAASTGGQAAIAFAVALLLFGLAAGFTARRKTDQA